MRYFPWLKGRLLLLHLLLLVVMASCQNTPSIEPGLSAEQLEGAYPSYREASLSHRRFKHREIVPLIQKRGQEFSVEVDRKSTRLNSSHVKISYAVFCLKKKLNG